MSKELIFSFTKKDFRVDYYRGSGPGGQKKNKTSNCCRITHIASGLSAYSEDGRSQSHNRKSAFEKLAMLLCGKYIPKSHKERLSAPDVVIRTYNEKTNRVKDHRSGDEFSFRDTIGKGEIDTIIEANHRSRK